MWTHLVFHVLQVKLHTASSLQPPDTPPPPPPGTIKRTTVHTVWQLLDASCRGAGLGGLRTRGALLGGQLFMTMRWWGSSMRITHTRFLYRREAVVKRCRFPPGGEGPDNSTQAESPPIPAQRRFIMSWSPSLYKLHSAKGHKLWVWFQRVTPCLATSHLVTPHNNVRNLLQPGLLPWTSVVTVRYRLLNKSFWRTCTWVRPLFRLTPHNRSMSQ